MKKILYSLSILLFIISCQRNEIVKTHGIAFLEKREKLIFINKSNKNDIVSIFGQPSTKGMDDDNLWIYIERTMEKGKLLKLGRNYLTKNNVLVLEFNEYGVLTDKKLSTMENMKKLAFAEDITENEIRKENFIYSFLSSVRQKMQVKKK
jgi:outer membrane protein assembly factor BamE (lipoprotein component of BamABCDE complex)